MSKTLRVYCDGRSTEEFTGDLDATTNAERLLIIYENTPDVSNGQSILRIYNADSWSYVEVE
jgi:hypothetical protein